MQSFDYKNYKVLRIKNYVQSYFLIFCTILSYTELFSCGGAIIGLFLVNRDFFLVNRLFYPLSSIFM